MAGGELYDLARQLPDEPDEAEESTDSAERKRPRAPRRRKSAIDRYRAGDLAQDPAPTRGGGGVLGIFVWLGILVLINVVLVLVDAPFYIY